MKSLLETPSCFTSFVRFKENKELFSQPHEIKADPPMKVPDGIKRLADAFKNSKEVPIGKEIDPKAGGEKDVKLKSKKLYIVGGAVRDYLLGRTPKNYNLATDAHPEEVLHIIKNAKPAIHVLKQDPKKGVTKISVDGEDYEIHTLKKKSENPEEEFTFTTNCAEDSENRDLTINAMYYDIAGNKIIDHCGGIRHLQNGDIKFVGKASDKLKENGMVKYRAMRFMNTIPNGKFDNETAEAFKKAASEDEDMDTTPDKIRDEFLNALENAHSNVAKVIKSYESHGLLEKVFPKLKLDTNLPEGVGKNRAIILACLLKNNQPSKLVPKLKELRYTDREIKDAVYLINLLWFAPDYVYEFKKELLNTGLTKRQIIDWAKLNKLDREMVEKLVDYNLKVNGTDLAEKEGLQGDDLKNRVKELEAHEFKRTLRS